jgi:hypothetical protein
LAAKLTILSVFYCIPYVLLFFFKTSIPRFRHKCLSPLEPSAPHTERPPAKACAHSGFSCPRKNNSTSKHCNEPSVLNYILQKHSS